MYVYNTIAYLNHGNVNGVCTNIAVRAIYDNKQ